MKKIIIVIIIIIYMLVIYQKKQSVIIPEESIRFRIIANSNNPIDQVNKMNIIKEIYPKLVSSTSNVSDINTARQNIIELQSELKPIISHYSSEYQINYGNNYFPQKEFKGITYDEGNYESLVIELGQGQGENWWCVLFPPLCLLEAEENSTENIEYDLYVSEVINKYMQ